MQENKDDLFGDIKKDIESNTLPPNLAKLYSHYTKVSMNDTGLKGWRGETEFNNRLEDAIVLIDAGLYEKEMGNNSCNHMFKRAGEILEWLSHPLLNKLDKPLNILSAACYQLAGYPALALGLINKTESRKTNFSSKILILLLKSNFSQLQLEINKYWESKTTNIKQGDYISDFNQWVIDETVRSLGIVCAYMRWGDTSRLGKAILKVLNISKLMLDGRDPYSWLVAKLTSEVLKEYLTTSLNKQIDILYKESSDRGKEAFNRYLKFNFLAGKSLAWKSQIQGIERLNTQNSFALCTPTGSGKTTIAELAIIQSLFNFKNKGEELINVFTDIYPIALYLVPSRALATEVESKLSKVLTNIGATNIKVTGLYGGTDWGPTDAWITTDDPTVLICTFEKAEALIRFLGPLFLHRLSLVIIDEAHSVQFDGKYKSLVTADNRGLRLESLASRLITNLEDGKIIALSAVAEKGSHALSNWITGSEVGKPEVNDYRSTRQLVGKLNWNINGKFEIQYNLLNNYDLKFSDDISDNNYPFIQNPFEPFPIEFKNLPKKYTNETFGKRQRPYLFWAAIQKAKPDKLGNQHSVLVSITQFIDGYADDFVHFFEKILIKNKITPPSIFVYPIDEKKQELWNKCLQACEDYFGVNSNEYKLLLKGIAVHHGNMPGKLARLLLEVIEKKIVYLALATSTLSEGVNLPFETVIIPIVTREKESISLSEFKNLIGRAGRPGSSTEGTSLVMLEGNPSDWSAQNATDQYEKLITLLEIKSRDENKNTSKVSSPLAELINYIFEKWSELTGSKNLIDFEKWLEDTMPTFGKESEESLDSLDGLLISSIVEYEVNFSNLNVNREVIEDHLRKVWQNTYSYYVQTNSEWMEKAFLLRGGTLYEKIYPDATFRNRLYSTSISPRFAKELLSSYQEIIEFLMSGNNYANWTQKEKFEFICNVVRKITSLTKFKIKDSIGKGKNTRSWEEILHWWLDSKNAKVHPEKKEIAKWIKFIKKNFEYLFNWGLGSIISLRSDEIFGTLKKSNLQDWEKTGLPWIIFWIKELIVWGTLDPVAAHILSHGIEDTRVRSEEKAKEYYLLKKDYPDELLNASEIRKWIKSFDSKSTPKEKFLKEIKVTVIRKFKSEREWHVLPAIRENRIAWLDSAGYEMAISEIPVGWKDEYSMTKDFILNIKKEKIIIKEYI